MTSWKDDVRAATTLDLSPFPPTGPLPIDGVGLKAGDRVLVKDQSNASQNGIWVVAAVNQTWTRAIDANTSALITPEMAVRVSEGIINAHTEWFLTTKNPITLGTTGLVHARLLPWADAKAFGAKGDGSADDSNAIIAAITSGAGTVLFPIGTYKISRNLTFPSSIALQFLDGAVLNPSSAVATINGPVIAADAQHIFAGTGVNSAINQSGGGPLITVSVSPLGPYGNYSFKVQVIVGGTVGTATFQYSLDGGSTWSSTTTTQSGFTVPGTGELIHFPAGTYVASTTYTWTSNAPFAIAPSMLTHVSCRWWGAKGDGSTDDTAAIQAAIIALASAHGGTLYFPVGTYKITQTLIYDSQLGSSIHFKGALSGIGGSALVWGGADGAGPVMTCTSLTGDKFSDLLFGGRGEIHGPKTVFWVRETPNPPGGGSSEDTYFDRCGFGAAVGPDSAAFLIGDGSGGDISELRFNACTFSSSSHIQPGVATELIITNATNASPIVIQTSAPHGLVSSAAVFIFGVTGNTAANGAWVIKVLDPTHFSLNGSQGNGNFPIGANAVAVLGVAFIANATNTSPIEITTNAPHGLVSGAAVVISGVTGNTAANGASFVSVIDPTHFSLDARSHGNGQYGGGGIAFCNAVSTCERGVKIAFGANNKNFSFINCTWLRFLKSGVTAKNNSGVLLFVHPIMGASAFRGGLIADFEVGAVQTLVVLGAETEGSARALYGTGGENFGAAVLDGYNFNGACIDFSADPDSPFAKQDVAIYWQASLFMRGCYFANGRTVDSVPLICCGADALSSLSTSIHSEGNFFNNTTFLPFHDNPGANLLVEWQDFAKGIECPITSRGDMGGVGGGIIRFPSYEGANVRVGRQQMLVQFSSLAPDPGTPALPSVINAGILVTSIAKFSVDYTNVQAAALTKEILLGQLLPKTRILNIIADTTTPYAWANAGADTISLAVGGNNAIDEYLISHNVKAAAIRKGEHMAELGTDLAAAANNAFGFIPSWTAKQQIVVNYTSGGQNLSGLSAGHTDFYIVFQALP